MICPARGDSASSPEPGFPGQQFCCRPHFGLNRQRGATEVISANLCDVAVLEMGQDERGAGDVAVFAGAGSDVLEGAPAAGEQGEPAFSETAQRALDCVAGASSDIGFAAASGLPDRDEDA